MATAPTTLEEVEFEVEEVEFEVFLSFRGPDTRDNFTSCLYREMVEKGIRVFKDNEELQTGQKIGRELLQALEDTQIYIPIFSKDFASSSWCLREVAHMIDCTSKSDSKKHILPIFFNVEPDDVKLKTELYRDALSKHLEKYGPDEVKRWEAALVEIPTRVGWKLEGREYGELIGSIVREVQLKLKVKHRSLPNHLVKVDDQDAIEKLLDVDSDDIRFVIIHGTGGIGKSTLAKVIFNRLWSKFDCSSFLEDVQDLSQRHGILHVQKKLLLDTLGSTSTDSIYDSNDGINRIRKGLRNKKVMVVVDNVNEKKQLENLAGSYKWFGSGSKIIITVRDKRTIPYRMILDQENQTGPSYYMDYPVKQMTLDQAIRLFSKHAFRSNSPPQDWYNFSKEVVLSIGRLPLTMEVVGSLFTKMDRSKWHEKLRELKQVPCDEVRNTLMISFNTLDLRKKEIFLDIACFCIGEDETNAYYMWEDCGYSPRSAIEDLQLMSLIKIDNNKFRMHDELRDLGRYIVKEENFEDAGKRRWAWIDENTSDILRSDKEKPDVRALSMGSRHDFTPEELACLPMLKFIGGKSCNFFGDFKNLFPNLRWLSWHQCMVFFFPENFIQVNLVVLDVSYSHVTHYWEGWRVIKMAKKLKVLDLTSCKDLKKTPDFSEFGKLEKLILAWCVNLSTIDSSIGKLQMLKTLSMEGCNSLKGLPEEIGKLQWLKTLNMEGCNSLEGLPEEIGYLECLSKIIMPVINKSFKFPKALGILKSLTELHIEFGNGISQLHPSIGRLKILKHLLLSKCKNLHKLPDSVGELESLVKLDLEDSGISILPDSIGRLTNLRDLLLSKCKNLHVLPDSIGELKSLVKLDLQLSGISILSDSIGNLKRLKVIKVANAQLCTIPCALGRVETLEVLDASFCLHLMDQIPWEMWRLTCLRILDLYGSPISTVPTMISGFSSLQTLKISSHRLHPLPELPSSLKYLVVEAAHFPVLPDLSSLIHLEHLEVRRQRHMTFWMPNEVTSPWKDAQSINRLPPSLLTLKLHSIPQLPDIFNFQNLLVLSISGCLTPRLSNLSCLKRLQKLWISDFPRLVEIPGLGELESLNFLHITTCDEIKQLPNLWKLKNLQHLEVKHCGKLRAIEGLKELNFLKIAMIKYCMSLERLPDMPTFTEVEINLTSLEVTEPTIQVGKRLRLSMD